MSKKTFAAAPKPKQPTPDDIDAYVNGGAGHDRPAAKVSPAPVMRTEAEPTKRLSLDLPASVHHRFKAACGATGRKMVGEIQEFITRRTKEMEDEAGITHK